MSSHTATAKPGQIIPYNAEDSRKFYIFIYLAMAMAVITGIEIVIVWLPIANWIQLVTLTVLSLVKFFGVIWWFMHMRWDRALIGVIFLLGLLIAGGTVAILLALFHFDTNEPVWEETPFFAPEMTEASVPASMAPHFEGGNGGGRAG